MAPSTKGKGKGKGKTSAKSLEISDINGKQLRIPKAFSQAGMEARPTIDGGTIRVDFVRPQDHDAGIPALKVTTNEIFQVAKLLDKKKENITVGVSKSVEMLSRLKRATDQTPKNLGNELFVFDELVAKVHELAKTPGGATAQMVTWVTKTLDGIHQEVFKPDGLAEVWARTNQKNIKRDDLKGPKWLLARLVSKVPDTVQTMHDWIFPRKEDKKPFLTMEELTTYETSWMGQLTVGFKELANQADTLLRARFPKDYEKSKQAAMLSGFKWILYPDILMEAPDFKSYKDIDPWTANFFTVLRHFNYMRGGFWSQTLGNSKTEEKNLNQIIAGDAAIQAIRDLTTLSGAEKMVELEKLTHSRKLVRDNSFKMTGTVYITKKGKWVKDPDTPDEHEGMATHLLDEIGLNFESTQEKTGDKGLPSNVKASTVLPIAVTRTDLQKKTKSDKEGNIPPRVRASMTGHYLSTEFQELAEYLAGHGLSADQIMTGILLHDYTPAYGGTLEINFSEDEED